MTWIIDAHQDLAYNALTFGRDYLLPAAQTRRLEIGTEVPQRNGQTLLGWPDFQRGQIALIFGTLFAAPRRYASGAWETQIYKDSSEAIRLLQNQLSYYQRLCGDHPDQFRLIKSRQDMNLLLAEWEKSPAYLSDNNVYNQESREEVTTERETITHPVGLVLLMEGLEGIRSIEQMEEWWQAGVRIAGPVWAGGRFCGGTYEPGGFTREGFALLEVMGELGFALDISHMNEESTLQAIDRYQGPILATHANVRSLLHGVEGERQLTDQSIRRLIERDGVMGVIPFNKFLRPSWTLNDDRLSVTLHTLAAHIDHICQIAGDDLHAGLGTDFDGGFGWPSVPYPINTIADLQMLGPVLEQYGYNADNTARILGKNWHRHLERTLPDSS